MSNDAEDKFLVFKKRVTLRQIEILSSLSETGSITKTARNLNITPAAVSQVCSRFESHFDFPVFEKKRWGLAFSDQGKALFSDITSLFKSIENFHSNAIGYFERQTPDDDQKRRLDNL